LHCVSQNGSTAATAAASTDAASAVHAAAATITAAAALQAYRTNKLLHQLVYAPAMARLYWPELHSGTAVHIPAGL
jgi:hypothetical protein